MAEAGAVLPSLDAIGVGGPMAGSLSRLARRTRASLRKSSRQVTKFKNQRLATSWVISRKTWRDGLKIGLHGIDHAPPFVHQAAPAPRQALEDVVLLGRCHDFLEHIAGHRQVVAELEQLQSLSGVDAIALGGWPERSP